MHILYLTHYFTPESNAPAARVHGMAREWARIGHRVTVLTCAPNVPSGVVYEGYENKLYQEEWIDGIRTVRVWTWLAANRGRVRRGLNYLSYLAAAGAAGPLLRPRADVVIATSPQFFAGWAGWPVARAHGAPFVLEIRDIWPDSIVAVGALEQGRIVSALGKLERALYEGADHIVAVGDGYRMNMIRKGIGPRLEDLGDHQRRGHRVVRTARARPGAARAARLLAGDVRDHLRRHHRHGERARGRARRRPPAQGEGTRRHRLPARRRRRRARRAGGAGARGGPHATSSSPASCRAPSCRRTSRAATPASCTSARTTLFGTILPSKFFEDAAMERPILLGFEGDARAMLEEADCGIAFEPSNDEELTAAAERLAAAPAEERRRLGENGRRYVLERFDRRTLAHDYLEILERVRADHRRPPVTAGRPPPRLR